MPSKIDVDPLLAALFDLPAAVHNNGVRPSNVTVTPSSSSGRSSSGGRRGDDGVESDNTLLHGESISLTDEEYSDAVAHMSDTDRSSSRLPGNRPSSFTTFRPNMVALSARLPPNNEYARSDTHQPVNVRHPVSKTPDHFVAQGGRTSPPLLGMNSHSQHHTITTESKPSNNPNSPSKKKKKKWKSLKKLVGRKSKSSSKALTMSSSFDEADSLISSPSTDPISYVGDSEKSPNSTPQNNNFVDDCLSLDRLSDLNSNIGTIRSNINKLEGDLIATRNELARAHKHLHLASIELADVQRVALEADIGLSKFVQQQHGAGGVSPSASEVRLPPLHFFEADMSARSSSRSNSSSDRLNYFTPTSSMNENDSDCFTPRSTGSFDSFFSLNENDTASINTPNLDEGNVVDKDMTPLTKNGKKNPKHNRRFKFDSGVKGPNNTLTYGMESNSIDTPSTAASTQEEVNNNALMETDAEQKSRRITFCKKQSFIRTHDLVLANGIENSNALVPLHENDDVSDVVNALFEKGYEFAMDESDWWYPEQGTGKILSKRAKKLENGEIDGPMGNWPNAAYADEVLVWTSKVPHDGHGSVYPVVKARGLIPTSALQMVQLLLDSNRVKQYNKMSLGRIDEHCFVVGVDRLTKCPTTGIHGELKIVCSKSQPPVIRKPVELRLLLHARRLPSEEGEEGVRYLTIGRSVWETEHGTAEAEDTSATRCEMLLSVNLIRDVQVSDGGEQWCEITTITHGVSPGIPISIGKRIGLAAAAKYVRDIRAVFE